VLDARRTRAVRRSITMPTSLPALDVRQDHPPQPVRAHDVASHQPVRRVRLADRVALHVGLALVTWSRRPVPPRRRPERLAARRRSLLERERRERAWLRELSLLAPPR
jgi:hypothetical protein